MSIKGSPTPDSIYQSVLKCTLNNIELTEVYTEDYIVHNMEKKLLILFLVLFVASTNAGKYKKEANKKTTSKDKLNEQNVAKSKLKDLYSINESKISGIASSGKSLDRIKRHLFKKDRFQQQPQVVVINRYSGEEEEQGHGWGRPSPPPPTQGWTRPTTTPTTTTTQGWSQPPTTTRGWGRPATLPPPPAQHGWNSGGPIEFSGGHSWKLGEGLFQAGTQIVDSGIANIGDAFDRFRESIEEEKSFGISIYKGKKRH